MAERSIEHWIVPNAGKLRWIFCGTALLNPFNQWGFIPFVSLAKADTTWFLNPRHSAAFFGTEDILINSYPFTRINVFQPCMDLSLRLDLRIIIYWMHLNQQVNPLDYHLLSVKIMMTKILNLILYMMEILMLISFIRPKTTTDSLWYHIVGMTLNFSPLYSFWVLAH